MSPNKVIASINICMKGQAFSSRHCQGLLPFMAMSSFLHFWVVMSSWYALMIEHQLLPEDKLLRM